MKAWYHEQMRWFWTLVVTALVAVTGVRPPEPSFSDHSDHQKLSPESVLPVLAGRRESHRPPQLDPPVATVPVAASLAGPQVCALAIVRAARAVPPSAPLSARSSRGPPLG